MVQHDYGGSRKWRAATAAARGGARTGKPQDPKRGPYFFSSKAKTAASQALRPASSPARQGHCGFSGRAAGGGAGPSSSCRSGFCRANKRKTRPGRAKLTPLRGVGVRWRKKEHNNIKCARRFRRGEAMVRTLRWHLGLDPGRGSRRFLVGAGSHSASQMGWWSAHLWAGEGVGARYPPAGSSSS